MVRFALICLPCICDSTALYTHAVQPFNRFAPSRNWLISLLMQHAQHQRQHQYQRQHRLKSHPNDTQPLRDSGGSSRGPGQGHRQGSAGGRDMSVERTPTADAAELYRRRCEKASDRSHMKPHIAQLPPRVILTDVCLSRSSIEQEKPSSRILCTRRVRIWKASVAWER